MTATSASNVDSLDIVAAQADLLHTADGRTLIDLFTAHGTVWLGHCRPAIQQAIASQLGQVWITGGHPTPIVQQMRAALNAFLPERFTVACLASTGMEANEQAMRVARVTTGKNGALGFAGAMHGKSYFTAALGWDNGDGLALPDVHRIPCGPGADEATMLAAVQAALAQGRIGAVFVEPIHGTSHAWHASPPFYQALRALTTAHNALLVYDEVLTGFHRTGPAFCCLQHGVEPDIIVFGKACGNGFPVAGLAVRDGIALSPRMLLGSTFSNNALAAAAVTATLAVLAECDPQALARAIEATVLSHLAPLGLQLHGAGAMWVITLDTAAQATACAEALYRRGVCIGFHGCQLRLLPSLTIAQQHLHAACAIIAQELSATQAML